MAERQSGSNGVAARDPQALNKWSVAGKKLPPVNQTFAIHVYDFDNTCKLTWKSGSVRKRLTHVDSPVFRTPRPNPHLWSPKTTTQLMNAAHFHGGGWWRDNRFLHAVGRGADQEEARAWDGWWNETIVELVRLSIKERGCLTVMLTGRSEIGFADLLKRMVTSKDLDFDMICLKPPSAVDTAIDAAAADAKLPDSTVRSNNITFASTIKFKQAFLADLLDTYCHVSELTIYEDRSDHVDMFESFFQQYNTVERADRPPLQAVVVPVTDTTSTLDPVVEVAAVQQLLNAHNAQVALSASQRGADDMAADPLGATTGSRSKFALTKKVLFTAHMLQPADSRRLMRLVGLVPAGNATTTTTTTTKATNEAGGGAVDKDTDATATVAVAQQQHESMPKGVRQLANCVMINARGASTPAELRRFGGLGGKNRWTVVALGWLPSREAPRVWAARVESAPPPADGGIGAGAGAASRSQANRRAPPPSIIVIALGRDSRAHDARDIRDWVPLPQKDRFVITTTVSEKIHLVISSIGSQNEEQQQEQQHQLSVAVAAATAKNASDQPVVIDDDDEEYVPPIVAASSAVTAAAVPPAAASVDSGGRLQQRYSGSMRGGGGGGRSTWRGLPHRGGRGGRGGGFNGRGRGNLGRGGFGTMLIPSDAYNPNASTNTGGSPGGGGGGGGNGVGGAATTGFHSYHKSPYDTEARGAHVTTGGSFGFSAAAYDDGAPRPAAQQQQSRQRQYHHHYHHQHQHQHQQGQPR